MKFFLIRLFACLVLGVASLPCVAASANPQTLYIAPVHTHLGWVDPAPTVANAPLREALRLCLPPELASLPLTIDRGLESQQSSVGVGLTRRNALEGLVPTGAVLLVFQGSVILTRGQLLDAPPATVVATASGSPSFSAVETAPLIPTPTASAVLLGYDVSPTDHSLRAALVRWARQAGWAFEPGFWVLPRDLPIMAAGHFGTDFKAAVQALLHTSDSTDMPAKPCFYSNRVLRVVMRSEACNRGSGTP